MTASRRLRLAAERLRRDCHAMRRMAPQAEAAGFAAVECGDLACHGRSTPCRCPCWTVPWARMSDARGRESLMQRVACSTLQRIGEVALSNLSGEIRLRKSSAS
jgi:hypothetical protein